MHIIKYKDNSDTNSKFVIEVEEKDVLIMQDRIWDYVRSEITKEVIEVLKKQILSDEKYMQGIKDKIYEQ